MICYGKRLSSHGVDFVDDLTGAHRVVDYPFDTALYLIYGYADSFLPGERCENPTRMRFPRGLSVQKPSPGGQPIVGVDDSKEQRVRRLHAARFEAIDAIGFIGPEDFPA